MSKYNIIAVDGGGVRGVCAITYLSKLETRLQQVTGSNKTLGNYFDLAAGTSTGGIIVGLLRAGYSAREAQDFYLKHLKEIFGKRNYIYYVYGPKYSSKPMARLCRAVFGEVPLNALRPLMITAYNISDGEVTLFNNESPVLLSDAVMATAAAPTYFQPHAISDRQYVDGGVFATNPTLLASLHADSEPEDQYILSIGTGGILQQFGMSSSGVVQWAMPVIDIFMQASAQNVSNIMQPQCTRIQTPFSSAMDAYKRMDDMVHAGLMMGNDSLDNVVNDILK